MCNTQNGCGGPLFNADTYIVKDLKNMTKLALSALVNKIQYLKADLRNPRREC
jgi:hypothetical protein